MSAIGVTSATVRSADYSTTAEITVTRDAIALRVNQPPPSDIPADLRAALLKWLGVEPPQGKTGRVSEDGPF